MSSSDTTVYTPSELQDLSTQYELFCEMDATFTLLTELAARAPDGRAAGTVEFNEFIPVTFWWTQNEPVPLEAGKLTGPLTIIERVFACRANITNPEEPNPLWNQCYRTAAELLADLERTPEHAVTDPRIIAGIYRTVDGDCPHYWVEADIHNTQYVLETHAHTPRLSANNDRGGVHVSPTRPDEYVPTGTVYRSHDLQREPCVSEPALEANLNEIYQQARSR